MFAIEKGLDCYTSRTAHRTYKKYGSYDQQGWPQCLGGSELYEVEKEGSLKMNAITYYFIALALFDTTI